MPSEIERRALRERLRPYAERARSFSGWSFDYSPRRTESGPDWSYERRVRELLAGGGPVVDLGTGGGERFAEIITGFAGLAAATEEWSVNVPVAAKRLAPLGVQTVHCTSALLPFAEASLRLVLSRHEAIDPFEVARVLMPGGAVLTQQVENQEWAELRKYFPRWQDHGDHYAYYSAGFIAAGLEIVERRRHFEMVAFKFEELVSQLCVMPWTVPDFDLLGADLDALLELEAVCNAEGEILLTEGRYLLEARKPKAAGSGGRPA